MKNSKSLYHGNRFPASVSSCTARWYFRFQLSLRDIAELLFERGVIVSYKTIRRWADKFGELCVNASAARVVFVTPSARKRSCRASDRSGNASH